MEKLLPVVVPGGTVAQALTYVNALRFRAYGNTSGNVSAAALTTDFYLDERGRELYWEAHVVRI